ncbi:hypothetical protein [Chitinophaga sp. CF418]|uniref:hypothetical protein n=1 Tax=Chitinophaga sp. CF418 TaxID=1855287 RepID=UPI0009135398|nr:hypothetical protein [Chitinophaga sp. CF418]SHN43844.1 hypothetical protein SAMN05216311_11693 [Chitinophaga sp. CF418]
MKQHSGRLLLTLCFLSFSMTVLSCGKNKHKRHAVIERSTDATTEQTERVYPTYNAYTADTRDNKSRFKEHLQIELTSDVKDLYTYGDFMAIDYSVLMSFSCDQSTIDKIVEQNGLQLSTEDNMGAISFPGKFNWWKQEEIDQLIPYRAGEEDDFWQYLWYNPATRQAFYEEFSM